MLGIQLTALSAPEVKRLLELARARGQDDRLRALRLLRTEVETPGQRRAGEGGQSDHRHDGAATAADRRRSAAPGRRLGLHRQKPTGRATEARGELGLELARQALLSARPRQLEEAFHLRHAQGAKLNPQHATARLPKRG